MSDADGTWWVGGWRDVTAEVVARQALSDSEELFRVGMQRAGLAMSIGRPDERFGAVNDALCTFLGRSREELSALSWTDVTHPDDVPRESELMADVLAGRRDGYRLLKRFLHRDGGVRWADLTVAAVRHQDGGLRLVITQAVDMTATREAQESLTYLSRYDPLTGLHNRAWTIQEIDRWLADPRRAPVGLLMVDLDAFHRVNESLGHPAGDRVLRSVAERLAAVAPPEAFLARFGGDEFAMALPTASTPALESWARRIAGTLRSDLVVDADPVSLSLSVGIAVSSAPGSATTLVRDADAALIRARRARSGFEFYDESMRAESVRRLTIDRELRTALGRDELVVHYQPIVSLADGRVAGHEALVRWHHPDRGLLPPADFLDVAEETGLVRDVGRFVIDRVCARLAQDRSLRGSLSVNVSAVQLTDTSWVPGLLDCVRAHGVDPGRLVIEVTETAVLPIVADVRDDLTALRDLGMGIHLDDFGTGFSPVSLLRDLPVTGLKLDRSFVAGMTADAGHVNALVSSLADLGRGMGLDTIAEGIETAEQSRWLASVGWRYGQGYYYGRPAAAP